MTVVVVFDWERPGCDGSLVGRCRLQLPTVRTHFSTRPNVRPCGTHIGGEPETTFV